MLLSNTVVNLHQVSDTAWMEQVFLLLKKHYHLVSAQQIEAYIYGDKQLKNSCHITFDDGDESFYSIAFPLVKKHRIPVSIYVSPQATVGHESFWFQKFKAVDKAALKEMILSATQFAPIRHLLSDIPPMVLCKFMQVDELNRTMESLITSTEIRDAVARNVTLEQLKEISESEFVEIGAHTMNHPILCNESDANAEWEITASITELANLLNKPVRYFAYPNGHYGLDFADREMRILTKNGIRLAFTTEHKCFSKKSAPMQIPRMEVSKGSYALVLAKIILGEKWDLAKRMVKGKGESELRQLVKGLLSQG